MRALVVEDEKAYAEVVAHALRAWGYEVTCAGNGREAVECWEDGAFDLVCLDLVMPEMDGIEVVAWLTRRPSVGRIILMTGFNPHYAALAEKLAMARNVTDVHLLNKPFRLEALRQLMQA